MYKNEFHISKLIAAYLRGALDTEQEAELNEWLRSSPSNQAYFEALVDEHNLSMQLKQFNSANKDLIWNKALNALNASSRPYHPKSEKRSRKLWLLIPAVAASIIIVVSTVIFLVRPPIDSSIDQTVTKKHDILPGGNKAFITLANGETIQLSSAKTGIVIKDNNLAYNDGSVVEAQANDEKYKYVTVNTPYGGQYQITLPDQTKVWLNAASKIKFPTTFDGMHERKVEIAGELYFEVAKDQKHPFVVNTSNQQIEVLGTHFNVSAYLDDEIAKTTLLEGSVKLSAFGISKILKPGQEGKLVEGKLSISETDTDLAVAWTKNKFMFEGEPIVSLMRMVERWYDVEVIYVGDKTEETFSGNISRFDHISKVLKIVELTGASHFKIEGRKVYVSK